MLSSQLKTVVKTNLSFLGIYEDLLLENVDFGKLHRSSIFCLNLVALTAISGVRNGKIRADFYDDCPDIPDTSALDPTQKNMLLLDDCFLGKQNKAEVYYTRGRHINCDTIYNSGKFIILFPQDVKNLKHIHADHCTSDLPLSEFKNFAMEYGATRNLIL